MGKIGRKKLTGIRLVSTMVILSMMCLGLMSPTYAQIDPGTSGDYNDGIDFDSLLNETGDFYFGKYKHATELNSLGEAIAYENEESPMTWKVAGEEIIEDEGDGGITLISNNIIDTIEYGDGEVGSSDFGSSGIYRYLNDDFIENEEIFTDGEYSGLLSSNVVSNVIESDPFGVFTGEYFDAYYPAETESMAYIPNSGYNDNTSAFENSLVSWSSSNNPDVSQKIRNIYPDEKATLKDSTTSVDYWLSDSHWVEYTTGEVEPEDPDDENPELHGGNENLYVSSVGSVEVASSSAIKGIRPIVKLDPENIVYIDKEANGSLRPHMVSDYLYISELNDGINDISNTGDELKVVSGNTFELNGIINGTDNEELAYKIVEEDEDGNRTIVSAGTGDNSSVEVEAIKNLTDNSSLQIDGLYTLYVWAIDKTGGSIQASQPYSITLDINDSYITPDEAEFDLNEKAKKGHEDIEVELVKGANQLIALSCNSEQLINDLDYTIEEGRFTINKSFLKTLPIGMHDIEFEMNNGSNPVLEVNVFQTTTTANITPDKLTFDKFNKSSNHKDKAITIETAGNSFVALAKGSKDLVKGNDYTISENNITIKSSYMKKLPTGINYMTVYMNKGKNPTFQIKVSDSTPQHYNTTTLKKIKPSTGKFTKSFKTTRTSYKLKIKSKKKSVTLKTTKISNNQKVQIKIGKGKYKTKSSVKVALKKGKSKTVYIKVTSQSGATKVYKVKATRAKK